MDKLSISKIAKRLSASRNTIAKYLGGEVTQPRYKQRPKRAPVLGAWVERLEALLAADVQRPRKEQRTAQELLGAVRSACTCVGARRLRELSKRTRFVRMSQRLNETFGRS